MFKHFVKHALPSAALAVVFFGAANNDYAQESKPTDKINSDETITSSNSTTAAEQARQAEEDDVPPPFIALSPAETTQLNAVTDYKQRTQLCLQLADSRLHRAETLANDADFQDALNELAGYQAVVENGLKYLRKENDDSKKVRDNLKRFELALRAHAPRIETIRRSSPFSFGKYVKSVLNFARNARSMALEAFFSDSVTRGEASGNSMQTQPANGAAKKP